METPEDLKSPLPQGVSYDFGGWTLYQSYRTFTWPWLLRRGAVFWPLAILTGFAYGAWHSSGMGAWSDWPPLALRASVGSLIAVTAGPLLATIVRHLRLPPRIERPGIVVAVLIGLGIGAVALGWTSDYHRHLMDQYANDRMNISFFGQLVSRFLRATIDASVFALIIGGGGLALVYYFSERRRVAAHAARLQVETLRTERDLADMRLSILQAQVEPHFLFNTLASIRSLIATEPKRAATTVEALSRYLRVTLPRLRDSGVEQATLDRQIEICAGYLDLMNIRMKGRIRVRIEASDDVRVMAFPPLILLTLVENAVTHGVEPAPGPRMIAISARVDGASLVVAVEDDGVGLELGPTPGLGLANVRGQLQSRYGEQAALEVRSRPEGGVSATITIPATTV